MNPFFIRLKEATRHQHQLLDNSPIARQVMASNVSLIDYILYLKSIYQLHNHIESIGFPLVSSAITDLENRRKIDLILADLTKLGVQGDETQKMEHSENYSNSLYFNLGMIYVSEGSTLGGLYILKNILSSLKQELPSSFLNCYGDKTGFMWKNFLEQIHVLLNGSESNEREFTRGVTYAYQLANQFFNGK